jgi:hypothetical protein
MDWTVALLKESKEGFHQDEFFGPPGPEMRKKLDQWFKENIAGRESVFYLLVTHVVSARQQRLKIVKDGRTYRTDITGTLGTLEQGVKAMKDQLTAQWRAMSEWRI